MQKAICQKNTNPICNTTIFQTNLFIVNLAFSDLCMMTTQALPVSINAFVEDVWMYGPLMCRVYACIGGIFGMKSSKILLLLFTNYKVIFDCHISFTFLLQELHHY